MLAKVPLSTKLAVPEPVTVTLPAVVAVRVPVATPSVTEMVPEPASTSVTDRPANLSAVSSLVVKLAGKVFTGASLTAVMVMVDATERVVVSAPPFNVPPLSLIWVSVKVRLPAVGLSILVSW